MIGGDGGRGIPNAGQSPKYFYKPNKIKSVFSALFCFFFFNFYFFIVVAKQRCP